MGSRSVPEGSARGAEAKLAWIKLYRELKLDSSYVQCVPRLSRYQSFQRILINETLTAVDKRFRSAERVSVWSAGSGIDTISLYLKSVRGDSIELTVQDISPECISINKEMFSRCGLSVDFAVGDLFDSEYSEKFDIVINTGLLEHFGASDQSRLLGVFSDSLRPNGVYLTLTPFSGAKLYSICKKRMEAKGKWDVGPETPVMTLSGLESGDLVLTREYQAAARDQLMFVSDAFPMLGVLLYPLIRGLRTLPDGIEPLFVKLMGGYCLFSEFSKKAPLIDREQGKDAKQ